MWRRGYLVRVGVRLRIGVGVGGVGLGVGLGLGLGSRLGFGVGVGLRVEAATRSPSCNRAAAISGVQESRLTDRTWERGVITR